MALIKCKECKAEISNKAKTCPQCGAPIKLKTSPIAWVILAIMITIIVIGLINVDSEPTTNNMAPTPANNIKSTPAKTSENIEPPAQPNTSAVIPQNIELHITLNDFNKGMAKYLKTIPQCMTAELTKPKLFKNGQNSYQQINLNASQIDIIADIADSKKLTNIKFTSMGKIKNDNDLRAMVCAAYSIIRTLQPEYETQKGALSQASRIWIQSKDAPFEMSYFSDKIKAQHIPFEFNVYHRE